MSSIRIFLIAVILSIMTLGIFISALHGYRSGISNAQKIFDSELADTAQLLSVVREDYHPGDTAALETTRYVFQIWQDDTLLLRSANSPEILIAPLTGGFHDRNFNNHRWRTYSLYNESSRRWVITAERLDIRNSLAENIVLESVLPVLALLPVLAVIIWIVVGRGLAPLQRLANVLGHKRADDLSPIALKDQPVELTRLTRAANDLLSRLQASFEREKQFTANAAHELRTPVSALKIHLHNLSEELPDGEERLQALVSVTDRMGHLIEQMLALHRTTNDQFIANFTSLDLYTLVQGVIVGEYASLEDKNQQLEFRGVNSLLRADRFALETLMQNLLGNAVKYTPQGGSILITITDSGGTVTLRVEDSGSGIPVDQYESVFNRFQRIGGDQNSSSAPGCGLGLSIVRQIVELHKAQITLGKSGELGGLSVSIIFSGKQMAVPDGKNDG
ncbi:MAG: HAMP domain-containing protein [Gammaproteobacteria bacterium]|nr:HAMP domain-containing protein [Gammaproteobacteria bacterium]